MNNPTTGSGACAPRIRRSRSGWRWKARLALAVLACTFAGAGQAQTVYRGGLDEAVNKLTRTLVSDADLRDKRVLVKSEDFFELGTELRLKLSQVLSRMSISELTGHGVPVSMAGSDEDAVMVLHGRWKREPDEHLYLELFVAAPVVVGDPTALKSVKGLVPIDESIRKAIESTLEDWGRLLMLDLERRVRDQRERKVLFQPVTLRSDMVQGGGLEEYLGDWIKEAFAIRRSHLFRLIAPPPGRSVETDGTLHAEATVHLRYVEVSLSVLDNQTFEQVTFARVRLDQELFPSRVVDPDDEEVSPVTDPPGGGRVSGGGARPAPDALHRAADAGDIEGLQEALEAGADVNARDGQGWTALMHAVARGYPLVVEPLLEADADPDVRAPDGATALFMAAVDGHTEIIVGLMAAEADVSIRGPMGRTAVDVARVRYGDAETARRSGEPLAVLALLEGMSLDDAAYARAEAKGTASAYAEYRRRYPEGRHAEEAERRKRERTAGRRFRDCPECPELVVVSEGWYMMGSPSGEAGRGGDEGPVHRVTFERPFAVGVKEVTFGEWDACVLGGGCGGYRPGDRGWGRGPRPVIHVNWDDAQAYVGWLSEKTGEEYRLLSESEWEYVARAGMRTAYWWGDEIGRNRANCNGCGSRWDNRQTAPVGSFSANAFGLYDVHGNVREWVEDCWNASYAGAPSDGKAWVSGDCGRRVLRGGSWVNAPRFLRSANRGWNSSGHRNFNGNGFRIARTFTP